MSLENKDGVFVCPSFTFIATAMSVARQGFDIGFVDVEFESFKPTVEMVIDKCCSNTVGVIWPHLFGEPTDITKLSRYCKNNGILLIEDCAQSFGSYVGEDHVGLQGDFGCFSFFPTKNLGCFGDGGAIITNREDLNQKISRIKNHGCSKKYFSDRIGGNFRLDEIQASILNTLFLDINNHLSKRIENARLYERHIENEKIKKPEYKNGHSWNQYSLIVDDNHRFKNYMSDNNIATMIYYPYPLHKNPVFDKGESLLNTENLCKRVVSIPIYPGLKPAEIEKIIEVINEYA